MPNISENQMNKFKLIYKEKYGKEISDKEAFGIGSNICDLIKVVYSPVLKKDFDKLKIKKYEYENRKSEKVQTF